MAFTIKQGDTAPAYEVQLLDQFGTPSQAPLNISSATQVLFKMRVHGATGVPKVSAAMTVVDALTGTVQHVWGATDTDTAGDFDVEFEITWSDGTIETIPNGSYMTVTVVEDLDH